MFNLDHIVHHTNCKIEIPSKFLECICPIVPKLVLTKEEVQLILEQLKDDYIPYENRALHKLLKEMRAWLAAQQE